jgi:hypothetical protein
MKTIYAILIILFTSPINSYGENGYSPSKALIFYKEIIKTDPLNQHLIKTRKYSIEDINNDDKFELLVYKNELNEDAEGLVNVELYPALEWVDVYSFQNGKYTKSNKKFQWFFKQREVHYKFWLQTIKNPVALNSDSQEWLKTEDRALILKALKHNLERINEILN